MTSDAEPRTDGRLVENEGPNRRTEDNITWAQVENRIRVLLAEFRAEMLSDIYTRNLDPLKDRVDVQDRMCGVHSQILTETSTLLKELVDAKLIRRLEVAESRIGTMQKFQGVIGTAALTSICGLLILILTHQVHL